MFTKRRRRVLSDEFLSLRSLQYYKKKRVRSTGLCVKVVDRVFYNFHTFLNTLDNKRGYQSV